MQQLLHIKTQMTLGGHLLPFEHPQLAAQDLTRLINKKIGVLGAVYNSAGFPASLVES